MPGTQRLVPLLALFLIVPALHAEPSTRPTSAPAVKITVDISDAPELKDFADKVQIVADKWYPIIVEKLPSEGFVAPTQVSIVFKKDYKGVAAAAGKNVVASVKYFTDHQDDLGAFVHELTHVVQHYTRGDRPGWLVEGIADYIRFYSYEPVKNRPHPNPDRSNYTDSYRTTAAFLDWVSTTYDKDLVVKLNTACRQAKYSEQLWKDYTGKTLDELNTGWKESLRHPETSR